MSDNNDQIDIKLILLGESGVGKTSIISRYVNDKFNDNFVTSSTMSYVAKIIEKNKTKIKLNIWDTI
jgi:GTPase SAR1 family protein